LLGIDIAMSRTMNSIIILEDNVDLADGLKDVLEGVLAQRVVVTESGFQALTYVAQQNFNIGLFDVNLPEINGIATLKELRRQGYTLPIIFMTGFRIVQLVNEVFPQVPVKLVTEPNIFSQMEQSKDSLVSDAVTLAYGTNTDEVERVRAFCLESMGFCRIDASYYEADDSLKDAGGFFYDDVVVTEALAHALFLREQGFIKPVVISGVYVDQAQEAEPFTRFDVTGCVFKPFDLQKLLELIMEKMDTSGDVGEHRAG